MNQDLKPLVEKLNPVCRRALEGAAGLCASETHFTVEIEHLLAKLLGAPASPETDVVRILRYYGLDSARLLHEAEQALARFERGNGRTPAMSPHVGQLLREAWLVTSVRLGAAAIRSGALLAALLEDDLLRGLALQSLPGLSKLPLESLRQDLRELVRGSGEEDGARAPAGAPASGGAPAAGSPTPALDLYTIDLTARARAGQIDPIRGRDSEIRQVLDILSRRRQNNPILTGEAGVGKTAVVEGLALRIAAGGVPPAHRNISLRLLDLGLLQAGASLKGEFENRLKAVIEEVKGSPRPVILFIDEAHTLIGAGGVAGQGDAANLLKPALARGELRTIAATTWAEYKRYFEKDPALARRFQVVKVGEPDESSAVDMLRGLISHLEEHHGVRVLDEAVRDAVALSQRYISGRQLPDKAISVLDTACARVALAQNATPPALEEVARDIERLESEAAMARREQAAGHAPAGAQSAAAAEARATELALLEARRGTLAARWRRELKLVQQILKLQGELERHGAAEGDGEGEAAGRTPPAPEAEERAGRQAARLVRLREELRALQGEEPMVPVCVDSQVVAGVVSSWTGIPAGRMHTDEIRTVLDLERSMAERLVGQPQALAAICRRIHTSRAGLDDPAKPIGVFLLVGPSGVGKTETAVTLAELLYGGARHVVVVNMSEFQEAHTVSTLKGAPPGYVGYGTGGVLTEAVRRNPYSVVLLDEMEKAHRDLAELFYQVFDKGTLEDGEGVPVDFRHTVILLTSNAGADAIARACQGRERPRPEQLAEEVRPALLRHFSPALLGRLVVVPYYPLGDREIRRIVELKLARIRQRVRESHRAELTYGEDLVDAIASRCTEVDSGARNIDHILTQTLLPELSAALLGRIALGESFSAVHVSLDDSGERGGFVYTVRG